MPLFTKKFIKSRKFCRLLLIVLIVAVVVLPGCETLKTIGSVVGIEKDSIEGDLTALQLSRMVKEYCAETDPEIQRVLKTEFQNRINKGSFPSVVEFTVTCRP